GGGGWVLDGDGLAEPGARDGAGALAVEEGGEEVVFREVAGDVALEDDGWRGHVAAALADLVVDGLEVLLALDIGEPNDLEEAVALDAAADVVVDRLAGAGEEARGGVVLGHDEVRVGLAALQRDADGHLSDGRAGDAVGAAEGLRAEDHVHA